MNYLAIGIGGMFGSVCRYGFSILFNHLSLFPYGTLGVNLIGSFLLSFITYGSLLQWQLPRKYLLAINTGFIGSFTTFSAFSVEIVNLLFNDRVFVAFIYVFISLTAGFALSLAGISLAHKLYQKKEAISN